MELIPSVSSASPTIMEKEKSDNSGIRQLSNGDSGIKPVMGASSWPSLSETKKSSSDSLTSLGDGSSSSSFSVPFSQQSVVLAELVMEGITRRIDQRLIEQQTVASAFTNGNVGQPSGQTKSTLPGQNQRTQFASQSHCQRNSHMNQNGNNHPHQHRSFGGMCNQEHNWSVPINFNGSSGFAQPPRVMSEFVRPPPPPLMPPFYAQYMPVHQLFYHMVFHELAPLMMYHPHRMPFIKPLPAPLETKIMNQVHYYLSVENLSTDEFLRKRMNDEGFVHIQFIAGFNKLKALTENIQVILEALRRSHVVELKGYEIRNRHTWRRFLMPHHLRVPFYPSPEYEQ